MKQTDIFVFGSNKAGWHGKGDALHARLYYGARYGQGFGLQGTSYAIPTKDAQLKTLPIHEIEVYINRFIKYAALRNIGKNDMRFVVTPVGCGLAGYSHEEIAPLFSGALALDNVVLPQVFLDILNKPKTRYYKDKICIRCGNEFTPTSSTHKVCCRG